MYIYIYIYNTESNRRSSLHSTNRIKKDQKGRLSLTPSINAFRPPPALWPDSDGADGVTGLLRKLLQFEGHARHQLRLRPEARGE